MALNEYIDETIDDLDLDSFDLHSKLCPKIWDGFELKEDVRRRLLDLSHEFYDSLDLDRGVLSDILFLGSLANYNWSEYSDIDIHLVMDFTKIDAPLELLRTYFDSKKDNWKTKHDITIFNFDVEFYVEDVDADTMSEGKYSLVTGSWIRKPSVLDIKVNKLKIQLKAEPFVQAVKEVIELQKLGSNERAYEYADRLYKKLYNYRKAGLEGSGEFSTENIVFKALRRNGTIDELRDIRNKLFDEMYSLKEQVKVMIQEILTDNTAFAQGEIDPDSFPQRTTDVTKLLKLMGEPEIELRKGRGYYYFGAKKGTDGNLSDGTNIGDWFSSSVMVYAIYQLTYRQWWEELLRKMKDNSF